MAEETKKPRAAKKEAPTTREYLVTFESTYGLSRRIHKTSVYYERDLTRSKLQFVKDIRSALEAYMKKHVTSANEVIHSLSVTFMIELCLLFFFAAPAMAQSAPQSIQMYEDAQCNKYTVTLNGGALSIASWGSTPALWCTIENPKRDGKFSYREGNQTIRYQLEGTRIKNIEVQSACANKELYACF